MHKVFFNSLSFYIRFPSSTVFGEELRHCISAVDLMIVAIQHNQACLYIESEIENIPILPNGDTFARCLANLTDKDLVRKWYLYSRNRSAPLSAQKVSVSAAVSVDAATTYDGVVCVESIADSVRWISARMSPFDQNLICLRADKQDFWTTKINSCRADDMRHWWPTFEPSPKHRREGYWSQRGDYISPMPLSVSQAQEALDMSVENGNERTSNYKGLKLRFLKTFPDRQIYHGFIVEAD